MHILDEFSKHPLASKTLWFNVLTVAVAILTALSGQAQHIPPGWLPYIAAGIAAANFALRLVTDKPLSLK